MLWRNKQLQYTWLRTLRGRYVDFWQVTCDALDFALDSLAIRKPGLHEKLMELYRTLAAFPEVFDVLVSLRRSGFATAILSNGSPAMLEAAVAGAGLSGLFDAVLSADAVGAFKTSPEGLSIRFGSTRSACLSRIVPILQWVGRICGLGLRHARGLVQPLWTAARTLAGGAGS